MQYVVILEEGPESWGAYVPDLPGCVAVGETREEALELIREAIEFHLDGVNYPGLKAGACEVKSQSKLD